MKLESLRIDLLRAEFEDLINSDEDFREQWCINENYTEEDFYEWFQDVISCFNFDDLKKYLQEEVN